MIIKTERLELVMLKALANDVSKLEEESNTNLHFWHILWLIIKKEDRAIIDTINFKGEPNAKGEVEIGYGLGKMHEHNGYMTESELDNMASQRVLQRCGFIEYDRDSTIWWRL